MKPAKALLLLAVAGLAAAPLVYWEEPRPPGPDFSHYRESPGPLRLVQVMSGRSNHERREVVKQALDAAAISYREEVVSNRVFHGANLVVEMGEGRDILLFSAHMDRVEPSPGANDNASCVAAGVQALKELKAMGPPEALKLRFLFSDGEEAGLHGARHHADASDLSDFFGVVSFEMCGLGDAFGVWDVVGPAVDSPIVEALRRAGGNLGVYHGTHGAVPRFGSDHMAFSRKGLAAVGVTVLPREDEQSLRGYVADPNHPKWLLNFVRPTIFRTYHTSGDGPEIIQSDALNMTTRLMLETVRVVGEMVKQG